MFAAQADDLVYKTRIEDVEVTLGALRKNFTLRGIVYYSSTL